MASRWKRAMNVGRGAQLLLGAALVSCATARPHHEGRLAAAIDSSAGSDDALVRRCHATMAECRNESADPFCELLVDLDEEHAGVARDCLGGDDEPIVFCDSTVLCLQVRGVFPGDIEGARFRWQQAAVECEPEICDDGGLNAGVTVRSVNGGRAGCPGSLQVPLHRPG